MKAVHLGAAFDSPHPRRSDGSPSDGVRRTAFLELGQRMIHQLCEMPVSLKNLAHVKTSSKILLPKRGGNDGVAETDNGAVRKSFLRLPPVCIHSGHSQEKRILNLR